MKVLMTTDNIGGVWTYSLSLAHGLKSLRVEVVLCVIGDPLTAGQRDELEGLDYFHILSKQEWMDDPWGELEKAGVELMRIKDIVQPDLMHFNTYTLAGLKWDVPVLVAFHSCVLTWWQAVKKEDAPAAWNMYRQKVEKGIRNADIIIAPGNSMMASAEKYYGPFKRKIVIYNGLNPSSFRPGKKDKLIFSMGRLWDEAKNCRLILDAASGIKYPVVIAGDNKLQNGQLLPAHVHFTGVLSRQEIFSHLSRSALYVLPVKYEPFGYTFLEAALSGCALVGGDIDSLHEVWDDAMVYVDPDNATDLADTINYLLRNPDDLASYAEKAYRRALRYQQDKMLMSYRDLYAAIALGSHKIIIA
jgi:glycosyltransferase involved in cell wall biosynthesis